MASVVWTWIVKLCIFTQILNLSAPQTVHMRNVAINRRCGLSSKYSSSSGGCSAAINGNSDTTFNTGNPPNCIHTDDNDMAPFWWVDLGQDFAISNITIFGRKRFIQRMKCVNVSLDGQLVKRFTDQSGWVSERYDITVRLEGRLINITRDCSTDAQTINICEVQVWVCDDEWYGDCTHTCGHCAGNSTCDKVDGNCTSCDMGFQPPLCQVCIDGRYGDNCTQTCGNCAEGPVCDKVNGSCNSCRPRFQPPLCKADTDRQNECESTAGPIVGAVCGSIAGCVVGFLLGILFMRCRVHQTKQVKASVPAFPLSNQTEFSSSPPEENRPPRPDSEDYELPSQPSNVYNSLNAACDDNVYTKLDTAKEKSAR